MEKQFAILSVEAYHDIYIIQMNDHFYQLSPPFNDAEGAKKSIDRLLEPLHKKWAEAGKKILTNK